MAGDGKGLMGGTAGGVEPRARVVPEPGPAVNMRACSSGLGVTCGTSCPHTVCCDHTLAFSSNQVPPPSLQLPASWTSPLPTATLHSSTLEPLFPRSHATHLLHDLE